jgi:hypothetical protein
LIDILERVAFSRAGAELLFGLISRAYEHHSLMLTTNLAFEEWTEAFGSEGQLGVKQNKIYSIGFKFSSPVIFILFFLFEYIRFKIRWKGFFIKPSSKGLFPMLLPTPRYPRHNPGSIRKPPIYSGKSRDEFINV